MAIFNEEYQKLLLNLIGTPTVNPFEMKKWDPHLLGSEVAFFYVACIAEEHSLKIEYHAPAPESHFREIQFAGSTISAPKHVTELFEKIPEIAELQPNYVFKAGDITDTNKIICFNAHMDTAADVPKPRFEDNVFHGRGAVDMKGPLTSTLAGIIHAMNNHNSLLDDISIRLQVVSGEEGGALGIYGTGAVVKEGLTGRLNIFCEPTNLGYFDAGSTFMTAMVITSGEDSHDSTPELGFHSRHILGFIDHYLEKEFIPYVLKKGCTVCDGALQTEGQSHSRVYGKGFAKWNILYTSVELGKEFKDMFEREVGNAIIAFREKYRNHLLYGETAKQVEEKTKIEWLKSGFPVQNNRDSEIQKKVLFDIPKAEEVGIRPFCCDALWGPPYTIVLGPGDLGKNKAHNEGEYIELKDLEAHAQMVSKLIGRFRDYVKGQSKPL